MKFQDFNFETDLCVERELVYSIVTIHRYLQITTAKEQGRNEQHSFTLHKLHSQTFIQAQAKVFFLLSWKEALHHSQ